MITNPVTLAAYKKRQRLALAKWTENNPQKLRAKHVERNYNLSGPEYYALYDKQEGLCALCQDPISAYKGHSEYPVAHVDHCHTSGKVRGLLCNRCNKGLGHFRDDIPLLEKAINYLQEGSE